MTEEVWRPVLGWEGRYEVSSQGRVRSLVGRRPRVLRPRPTRQGYPMVALYRDNVRRDVGIHLLVAEAFHGPRPEGLCVCHANDVKHDNRPENLRFDTWSENQRDRVRNGTHELAARTHCKRGHKFTPENTRIQAAAGRLPYRACRTCARIKARARRMEVVA